MNTRALEHEGAMVEVYSKMKPDAFPSQLQNILKPITRISRGLWAPAVATSPRWSSASSRTKMIPDLRQTPTPPTLPPPPPPAPPTQPPPPPRRTGAQSRTRRGRASSGPQPCGQGRGRKGAGGRGGKKASGKASG